MTTGLSIDDFELVQPSRDPMKVQSNWSLGQKIALAAGILILSGLGSLSYFERSSLDIGLAYSGGVEALKTGHPENLWTWISTPFLATLMAVFAAAFDLRIADASITTINLLLSLAFLATFATFLRNRINNAAWMIAVLIASFYAPLLSSIWWKQFNLIALALAAGGFWVALAGRTRTGGLLTALSLAIKPIAILLPLVFLVKKESRRLGAWTIGWGAGLFGIAQIFLAWRARDWALLSPLISLRNFQAKTALSYGWVCNPENFSPASTICLIVDNRDYWPLQKASGYMVGLLFVGAMFFSLAKRRGLCWTVFALTCAVSPMVSPIAWSHYQLFLAPLFAILLVDLWQREVSSKWRIVYLVALALSMLIARPYLTVLGLIPHTDAWGPLAWFVDALPQIDLSRSFRLMLFSQSAQYLIASVAILWFSRKYVRPGEFSPRTERAVV